MMKKPTKKSLNAMGMRFLQSMADPKDSDIHYIDEKAGQEHYRLLKWLGNEVEGSIIELGTFKGYSALALADGGRRIVSCDIENKRAIKEEPDNVEFIITENGHELIDHSFDMVFIDTMHDGEFERKVLDRLREIEWKGIVVMDDIVLFPELAKLWDEIEEKKEDWTNIGHHSGTGIIYFE